MSDFKVSDFFKELRRRRVFRVAGIYIVGAFVVLQVSDLALPAFGLAADAIRYIWIGAMLGIPIALVTGWRYDIKDGRIVRTSAADHAKDLSLQRVDYMIISALGLLAIFLIVGVARELTDEGSSANQTASIRPFNSDSIAVLPFKDTSIDQQTSAAIALGVQDGLLTMLSKIDGLKVISRTSVEQYRNAALGVPAIGRQLGVGAVLEGSVQVINDRLRVNVQLIDTATDEHRWAEIYDRDLTAGDIFSVQSEIVSTVVAQIRNELSPRESSRLAAVPTENLDAYIAYLKGKSEFEKFSAGSNGAAIKHFETAVDLDPNFALAYAGWAGALLESSREFRIELAEIPLARAFELDDQLSENFIVLGTLRHLQSDYLAAEDAYNTAVNLEPANPRIYQYFARLRHVQGRDSEALPLLEQARSLSPNSAGINYEVARLYDKFGRFDEAMAAYKNAMILEPERYYLEIYVAAIHYLVRGEIDESLYWYHKGAVRKTSPSGGEAATGIAYLEIGDPANARVMIERGRVLNPDGFWPLFVDMLLSVYLSDEDAIQEKALELLEHFPRSPSALRHLRSADLEAGRFDNARRRYARAYPELFETPVPDVNRRNFSVAIDLAPVLQRLGLHDAADGLLAGAEWAIQGVPRLGTDGFWISDASIHALRGDSESALDALADAIAQGWRIKTWYVLDSDPNLESIRDEPRFQQMRTLVMNDLAQQAKRVEEIRASGDIEVLPAIPDMEP